MSKISRHETVKSLLGFVWRRPQTARTDHIGPYDGLVFFVYRRLRGIALNQAFSPLSNTPVVTNLLVAK